MQLEALSRVYVFRGSEPFMDGLVNRVAAAKHTKAFSAGTPFELSPNPWNHEDSRIALDPGFRSRYHEVS